MTFKCTAIHMEISERQFASPVVTDPVIAEDRYTRKLDLREAMMVVPGGVQPVLGKAPQRSGRHLHAAYISR